jgi:hypothetical protein
VHGPIAGKEQQDCIRISCFAGSPQLDRMMS